MLDLIDREEAAEVEQAIAALETLLAGCDPEQIQRMMVNAYLIYPARKDAADNEEDARLKLYVKLLRDVPFDILSQAFADVCKTKTFFPVPAEILTAAKPMLSKRRGLLFDLKRLLAKHRIEWQDRPDLKDDEPMDATQIHEANLIFKRCGAKTRYRPDGTAFMLEPGMVDPVGDPEPVEGSVEYQPGLGL